MPPSIKSFHARMPRRGNLAMRALYSACTAAPYCSITTPPIHSKSRDRSVGFHTNAQKAVPKFTDRMVHIPHYPTRGRYIFSFPFIFSAIFFIFPSYLRRKYTWYSRIAQIRGHNKIRLFFSPLLATARTQDDKFDRDRSPACLKGAKKNSATGV